jgi:sn-glycerol 3-phosphate transport system ATP-binding protein/multiple sugar transport system ATP-binding protein
VAPGSEIPKPSSLRLEGVIKHVGGTPILRGIDLDVKEGEFVVLVGPSGCGKSTLLRTIAGLERPDAGTIRIGGREVTHLAPRERDVAMVFQSYALYPHLTVRENLAFGLKMRRADPRTIAERVDEVARMLGLGPLLDRYPGQLSGGQRQRVAMGRAIVRRPALFLFDEPLSNLDAALRAEVRVEIKRLYHRLGATMVYVTHDQVEAMTLADRLVVLRSGLVEQIGTPLEVYARPATRFVASFLGSPAMNFLKGEVSDGRVRASGLDARLEVATVARGLSLEPGRAVLAGIRPHDVLPSANGHADVLLQVEVVETLGFETYAHGKVGDQPFVARLEGSRARALARGDTLALDIAAGGLHLFDPDSERALP